jgi:DNA-binding XRE family transcriptional regulator
MKSDSTSKKVLRCPHCFLQQFMTAAGFCRRCRQSLGDLPIDSSNLAPLPTGDDLSAKFLARQIGATIRILRRQRRLSQERLAGKIGISRPSITKLESGKAVPSLAKLPRVAVALGIDIAEVFQLIRR